MALELTTTHKLHFINGTIMWTGHLIMPKGCPRCWLLPSVQSRDMQEVILLFEWQLMTKDNIRAWSIMSSKWAYNLMSFRLTCKSFDVVDDPLLKRSKRTSFAMLYVKMFYSDSLDKCCIAVDWDCRLHSKEVVRSFWHMNAATESVSSLICSFSVCSWLLDHILYVLYFARGSSENDVHPRPRALE